MVKQIILGVRDKQLGTYSTYVPKTAITRHPKKVPLGIGGTVAATIALYPLESFYSFSEDETKIDRKKYEPVFLLADIDLTKQEIDQADYGSIDLSLLKHKRVTFLNEVKDPALAFENKESAIQGSTTTKHQHLDYELLTYDYGTRRFSDKEFNEAIVPIVKRQIALVKQTKGTDQELDDPDISVTDYNLDQVISLGAQFGSQITIGRDSDATVSKSVAQRYAATHALATKELLFLLRDPNERIFGGIVRSALSRRTLSKRVISDISNSDVMTRRTLLSMAAKPENSDAVSDLHALGFNFSKLFLDLLTNLKEVHPDDYAVLTGNPRALSDYNKAQAEELFAYDDDDAYYDFDSYEDATLSEAGQDILEDALPNCSAWIGYVSASAFNKGTKPFKLAAIEKTFSSTPHASISPEN